jgi:hypothetical protein
VESTPRQFGPLNIGNYQLVMGKCAFINSPMLLGAIMASPSGNEGLLQMLFICGLPVAVFIYRYFPLVTVAYGILPLLHTLLGKWITLPLIFKGISVSLPFVNWAFAATAIFGYAWFFGGST